MRASVRLVSMPARISRIARLEVRVEAYHGAHPLTGDVPAGEHPEAGRLPPRYRPRTVSTGQDAAVTTREATLPRKSLASPVRPWVPSTITSAFLDLAARTICSSATPSRMSVLVFTPAARALSWRAFSRLSAYLRADASRSS